MKQLTIILLLLSAVVLSGCYHQPQGDDYNKPDNTIQGSNEFQVGDNVYVLWETGPELGVLTSIMLFKSGRMEFRVCIDDTWDECTYFKRVFRTKQDIIDMLK